MKKNLKYIEIEGVLKSRGEYSTLPSEYRPYEAVTFIDKDGEEVHFHTLQISKRMDEILTYSKLMTFYILRFRRKEKLFGVLYAIENEGEKVFFKDTAIPALEQFGSMLYGRRQLLADPSTGSFMLVGGALLFGFIPAVILNASGFSDEAALISAIISGGSYIYYALYPSLRKGKVSGLAEMKLKLKKNGFDLDSVSKLKY